MSRKYSYYTSLGEDNTYAQSVWELLCGADKKFIPALSARESPKDTNLNDGSCSTDILLPRSYFNEMKKQSIVIASMHGECVGFLSYRPNYIVPEIDTKVSVYVSTIIVNQEMQERGIATGLYQHLMNKMNAEFSSFSIATRTWSTNSSHLHILEKLGLTCVKSIKDARGEGIDTVIYLKQTT